MPRAKKHSTTKGKAVSVDKNGNKYYGPYDGADGRRRYRVVTASGRDTSIPEERYKAGLRVGQAKGKDVDHKDDNKHNNSRSNLRVVSQKENVSKENKRRTGKAASTAAKKAAATRNRKRR